MSTIYLHNTLTGGKEAFKPLKEGVVTMYNCGPTVYDYQHIGNFRSFIFVDTLRRMFEFNGYTVKQIINITDIGHLSGDNEGNADEGEDRMTKALKREGKPMTLEAMKELATFYADRFKEDLLTLNIERPMGFPFASEHIHEDIEMIQKLIDKGFTYKTSDGLYFDTSKMSDYGKLGGISSSDDHSRIGQNAEKKSQRDFALWKFNATLGYPASWGNGFPGWHIECSAMAMKYLGETIDIHTGGIEHISVHHNNEIAQSENYSGKPFAHYWLHVSHLQVDGGKMAKSLGNAYTIKNLEEHGYSPLDLRYLVLGAHYKSSINFTFEALTNARNSRLKLLRDLSDLPEGGSLDEEFKGKFEHYVNDDLNTPRALALVFEVLKSEISPADKRATIINFDRVLGLNLEREIDTLKNTSADIPIKVSNLVAERELARKNKQYDRSDMLRNEILSMGYVVEDSEQGPRVTKK